MSGTMFSPGPTLNTVIAVISPSISEINGSRRRMANTLRTLPIYRLAFGQPRQSELIDHLLKHIPPHKIPEIRRRPLIDLSPISYGSQSTGNGVG